MDEEKSLSETESLALINRMIHEGKNYFHESGTATIIWGSAIIICSALAFFISKGLSFPFNPFYIMIIAAIIQSYFFMKNEKKKKAKTFTDEAIDLVWTSFFISLIILVISSVIAGISEYLVISIALFFTAFAAFFTGMITKFRFMIFASFTCWLIAGICFFMQDENIFLLLPVAAVLVWIIPGFMMNAYLKKIQHA